MIAQNGKWEGKQIVPETWVKKATSEQIKIPVNARGYSPSNQYGYQWWIRDDGAFMAVGYSGQFAIIDPENNLAVVFLSSLDRNVYTYPATLYGSYIKPAVSDTALPENPESAAQLKSLADKWERELKSADTVPEPLVPYLNRKYKLGKNPLGIKSVKMSLENDVLDFTLNYGMATVKLKAGKGCYLVSDTKLGKAAAAVSYFPENQGTRIEIRIHYPGTGIYQHFNIKFSKNELHGYFAGNNGTKGTIKGE